MIAWVTSCICLLSWQATAKPPAGAASRPASEEIRIPIPEQARSVSCWLRRPAGYGANDRPALLIVLHGTDDTAQEAIQFWSSRRHELPFLLVAPQAVGKGWRDEDVPAVKHVLEDLRRRVPFDEKRLMLAGFSAGGAMMMHLLYAEKWPVCAAAALANYVPPRLTTDEIRPQREVPVFYAVGMTDINHEQMRVGLELLRSAGANIDLYRPQIGHVLDPQVGQAAMDWLLLRARRQVTTAIDAVKNKHSAESAAVLEGVVAQARWHDRANIDTADRVLRKMESPARDRLPDVQTAIREGRALDALDLLAAAEPECITGRLRRDVVEMREKLLSDPRVRQNWESRRRQVRNEEAMKLYAGAQRFVADRKYQDAVNRCDQVMHDYADTPAADRARYLVDLLRQNHLIE